MDRRKEILVNVKEIATDAALREAVEKWDAIIYPKLRVADALDIKNSGLTGGEYAYTLRAHFDFVVARRSSTTAVFAVEYDGKQHRFDSNTKQLDAMKNNICAKLGMPLIRMRSNYLRQVGNFTVIGWLVQMWFLYETWQDACNHGAAPVEEPFLFFSFSGYDPFIACRAWIQRLFELKQSQSPVADVVHLEQPDGTIEAIASVRTIEQRTFVGKGICQTNHFPVIPSVGPYSLTEELAVTEVAEKLRAYYQPRFPDIFA